MERSTYRRTHSLGTIGGGGGGMPWSPDKSGSSAASSTSTTSTSAAAKSASASGHGPFCSHPALQLDCFTRRSLDLGGSGQSLDGTMAAGSVLPSYKDSPSGPPSLAGSHDAIAAAGSDGDPAARSMKEAELLNFYYSLAWERSVV